MTRICSYCGELVDPNSRFVWRRVVGWERKSQGLSRKSGSDITLREARDEYACDRCVSREKAGVSSAQSALI